MLHAKAKPSKPRFSPLLHAVRILITVLPKVHQVARLLTNKKYGRVSSLFGPRNAHFDMKSICERHVKQPAIRCFFVPFRGRFIWNYQCGKPFQWIQTPLLLRTIPTSTVGPSPNDYFLDRNVATQNNFEEEMVSGKGCFCICHFAQTEKKQRTVKSPTFQCTGTDLCPGTWRDW